MEILLDHVMLSRLQFAFTAMFHIIWPVLTIGLSLFIVLMEALWLKTKEEAYYRHARFWTRLFVLNFAVGVITGIPMEFQFGTNWSVFSGAGGDIFGHLLGFEATMAFMLEAAFLGIMVWGWKRVSPRVHLFATSMVAFGSSLSAFWIMSANAWMQTPAGGVFQDGRFFTTSNLESILNPDLPWAVSHMWVACLEVTIFVVGAISAWRLLKRRHVDFFLKSFRIMVIAAIVITPLQIYLGDGSGQKVAETQPAKLSAMEAHWRTNPEGEGASWNLLAWPNESKQDNDWAITIPDGLSLLVTRSFTGRVQGLRDFPAEDQPPVWLPFYSFRVMAGLGFLFFFLMVWTLWAWRKGRLRPDVISEQKKLLLSWMAALPLSYVAVESGWVTREVGRQPWVIYGVLRTHEAASPLPAYPIGTSLLVFAGIYSVLFIAFLLFAGYIVNRGPEGVE
ncbi:MAG: cytochrome ubiquinol oxidase subunit I [Deltaproteobacteria bacterium]|nr:cytochrome ubiquinol oxidase subunit I [Deltaproteobacteria bacterium]